MGKAGSGGGVGGDRHGKVAVIPGSLASLAPRNDGREGAPRMPANPKFTLAEYTEAR